MQALSVRQSAEWRAPPVHEDEADLGAKLFPGVHNLLCNEVQEGLAILYWQEGLCLLQTH